MISMMDDPISKDPTRLLGIVVLSDERMFVKRVLPPMHLRILRSCMHNRTRSIRPHHRPIVRVGLTLLNDLVTHLITPQPQPALLSTAFLVEHDGAEEQPAEGEESHDGREPLAGLRRNGDRKAEDVDGGSFDAADLHPLLVAGDGGALK